MPQSYDQLIVGEPAQGWHPDYDPDFGTPGGFYLSPLIQPAPNQPIAIPDHEPAASLTEREQPSTYQPHQPQQYAWASPARNSRRRSNRSYIPMWAAAVGITFAPALIVFGTAGGWVCLAIWLVVGIGHRFSAGEPARILGVRPTPYVLLMLALLGYGFYLLWANGMLLDLPVVGLFALLCFLSWGYFRDN